MLNDRQAGSGQAVVGRRWGRAGVYLLSLLVQATMVGFGVAFALVEDPTSELLILGSWCLLGTLYAGAVIIALWVLSRSRPAADGPSRLEMSRFARFLSFVATLLASFVGLGAAFQLLALRADPDLGELVTLVGVWAMLLAWGLLHWGYAQLYYQDYYRHSPTPLRFPGSTPPGLVDFVYFSYSVGVSFSTSDVQTLTTRIRWRVLWHAVISFFFNALILVLALNTIMAGGE